MTTAYVGLGSNLGDREENIRHALTRLRRSQEVEVLRVSSLYETEPMGYTSQPDFLNAVARVETDCSPHELLERLQAVERMMKRKREMRWGPRVIDIDLLLYDECEVDTEELKVPHPEMWDRLFVLVPLLEIVPEPLRMKVRTRIEQLGDQNVRLYGASSERCEPL